MGGSNHSNFLSGRLFTKDGNHLFVKDFDGKQVLHVTILPTEGEAVSVVGKGTAAQ